MASFRIDALLSPADSKEKIGKPHDDESTSILNLRLSKADSMGENNTRDDNIDVCGEDSDVGDSELSSISDTEQENDEQFSSPSDGGLTRDVKLMHGLFPHPMLLNGQHPAFRSNLANLQQHLPAVVTSAAAPVSSSLSLAAAAAGGLLANSAFRSPTLELAQQQQAYAHRLQLELLARNAAALNVAPARFVDYHGESSVEWTEYLTVHTR